MVFILIAYRWQKERNNVGAHSYEVLIMIANKKCNLPFGLWHAVSK